MKDVPIQDWKLQSLIGLLGLGLVYLLNRSGLDIWISSHFFDAVSGSFPLRDEFLYSDVLHSGLKYFSVFAWLLLLLTCTLRLCIARTRKVTLASWSPSLIAVLHYILVSTLLCASMVAWLKSQSAHSCPWDLTPFGGQFDFFYLGAEPLIQGIGSGPGQCFPSGHASVGWMWIGVLLIATPVEGAARQLVLLLKCAVLALSLTVSVTQVLRGAHFASHVLMTAVVCWSIGALTYQLLPWPSKNRS